MRSASLLWLLLAGLVCQAQDARRLSFYFVDGGAAAATTVLIVTPSAESMLLGAGYSHDYVVITH
jgi:hypothetical protein